jgi:two-component system, chemotaxis family, chemotaxis protein CheY
MDRCQRLPTASAACVTLHSLISLPPTRPLRPLTRTAKYSTTLLNRASPFGSSSVRMTAQARGVLVVDDDPLVRDVLSEILIFEGYPVWSATNGLEALAVLDHVRPALAILDLRMPRLDGWGFARALDERSIWLPLLVITAAADGRHWADQIGAVGCLPKPFNALHVLAEVERLIDRD